MKTLLQSMTPWERLHCLVLYQSMIPMHQLPVPPMKPFKFMICLARQTYDDYGLGYSNVLNYNMEQS